MSKTFKDRNPIARDLLTPKYKQLVIPSRKRIENEKDNSYYFSEQDIDDPDIEV